jgi:hypothetical protein
VSAQQVLVPLGFFTMVTVTAIGLPLAKAYARRLEGRTGGGPAPQIPSDLSARMERLEHAIDSIAVEVERISEGQRFTTKLLSDRAGDRGIESQNAGVPAGGKRG